MIKIVSPGPGEKGFIETGGRAAYALKELGKIKGKTWKAMGEAFEAIGGVVRAGGFGQIFGGPIDALRQQVEDQITGAFAPILNEISWLIGEITNLIGEAVKFIVENTMSLRDAIRAAEDLIETERARDPEKVAFLEDLQAMGYQGPQSVFGFNYAQLEDLLRKHGYI